MNLNHQIGCMSEHIEHCEIRFRDCSERYGFAGEQVWMDFAEMKESSFWDENGKHDEIFRRLPTSMPNNAKDDFLSYCYLRMSLELFLADDCSRHESIRLAGEIFSTLINLYNDPPPMDHEMASGLRQGKKNRSTELFEVLAEAYLTRESIAQNVALTLIQPDKFEKFQNLLFKGKIYFRADRQRSKDGKILAYIDDFGNYSEMKLRSLENLVGRVKKRVLNQ